MNKSVDKYMINIYTPYCKLVNSSEFISNETHIINSKQVLDSNEVIIAKNIPKRTINDISIYMYSKAKITYGNGNILECFKLSKDGSYLEVNDIQRALGDYFKVELITE